MTKIHASGTSEAHYRAERATIHARISHASRDRSQSIQLATAMHNRVFSRAKQLRESGDATWHFASPISTWAKKNYAEGSKTKVVLEHTTSSTVQIKLANLNLVSDLVTELTELGASTHVNWALTETSRREHERTARKAAVGQAREIAADYADALGERVVRVISVSDGESAPAFAGTRAMSAAATDGFASAEVTVPEITVHATVAGVFESA